MNADNNTQELLDKIEQLKFELKAADETYKKSIAELQSLKTEAYHALILLDSNGLIDKRIFQGFDTLVKKLGDDN